MFYVFSNLATIVLRTIEKLTIKKLKEKLACRTKQIKTKMKANIFV